MIELVSSIAGDEFLRSVLAGLFSKLIEVVARKTKGFIQNKVVIDKIQTAIEKSFIELRVEDDKTELDYECFIKIFTRKAVLKELEKFNSGQLLDSKVILRELIDSDFFYYQGEKARSHQITKLWIRFLQIFYSKIAEDPSLSNYLMLRSFELLASKSKDMAHAISDILCQTRGIEEKLSCVLSKIAYNIPDFKLVDRNFIHNQSGRSTPQYFYKGHTLWSNVIAGYDFERKVNQNGKIVDFQTSFQELVENMNEPGIGFWLITAPAGEGKTTLLFRLGYELFKIWEQQAAKQFYVLFLQEAQIDVKQIQQFCNMVEKPIYVLIDGHHPKKIIQSLEYVVPIIANLGFCVKFIVTARTNEWDHAGGANGFAHRLTTSKTIELGTLTDTEIKSLIGVLTDHGCLGEISKYETMREKVAYVKSYSDKWLLVALMEATHGQPFEKIILNEYKNLPNELKQIYLYICFSYSLKILFPVSVMSKLFPKYPVADFPKGVVFFEGQELIPTSMKARHSLIAGVIIEQLLPTQNKIEVMKTIFNTVDAHSRDERFFAHEILEAMLEQPHDPDKPNKKLTDKKICAYFLDSKGSSELTPIIHTAISEMRTTGKIYEVFQWSRLRFYVRNLKGNKKLIEEMLVIVEDHPLLNFFYAQILKQEAAQSNSLPNYRKIERCLKLAYNSGFRASNFLVFYSNVEMILKKPHSAVKLLKCGITLDPDNDLLNIHFDNFIKSFSRRGAYTGLSEALRIALGVNQRNKKTIYSLVQSLRAERKLYDAFKESKKLISIEPVTSGDRALYATCLADYTEDYREATKILRSILQHHEKRDFLAAKLRNNLAIWLDKLDPGNEESERLWNEAIDIYPNFPWPYILLGGFYFDSRKDKDTASKYLERGKKQAKKANLLPAILEADKILERIRRYQERRI